MRLSAYIAAIRDARVATGRDADNGKKINPACHGNWLGAMGYLALLDQIGKCLKPKFKDGLTSETYAIIKALSNFSDLNEYEKYAIYALRCSFAHDFSLFNIPKNNNKNKDKLLLHFVVVDGDTAPLVTFPDPGNEWNGELKDKSAKNRTLVNLEKLGDLIEEICRKIREYADLDELEITLDGGANELAYRYFISTPIRKIQPQT